MTTQVFCPHCELPVDPRAVSCAHCGVNLALAAVQAELKLTKPRIEAGGMPVAPEILVPRLGDYLVENGVLTSAQLEHALEFQKQRSQQGKRILLGQALRELGYIDAETLDQAVTFQILELQAVLRNTNQQLEARVRERTQDLQDALDKLAELNQLKANFIANISHELRTPLTHIKGYLAMLAEQGFGPLTLEQQDAVEVLSRAADRLGRLIEDLLQFGLASQGKLNLRWSKINVREIVEVVIRQSQMKAEAKGIELGVKLGANMPVIHCDREKIIWVLSHLVDNAIKFTPEGGKVRVEAFSRNTSVHFAVTDTGIGIPDDRLEEIFEPLHQLDETTTRQYGGAGLGLTLAKRILSAHRSAIKVQSVVGRGSRFEFSLASDVPGKVNNAHV